MLVPLGEWLPDQAAFGMQGLTVATNCVAAAGPHYEPWGSLEPVSDALSAACLGAASGKDNDGIGYSFAGSAAAIESLDADGGWTDVTNTGGPYTTGTDDRWRFAQFGTLTIATNFADPIQAFELGADTEFSDLGTNAPKARHVAVVRDFLVVGYTDDNVDGTVRNRVRWSPIADPAGDWAISATTQADFQDIPTGGGVVGLVGGEFGIVLMEGSLYRMSYAGPPVVFQFDEIAPGRGCAAAGSIATDGRLTIFLSEDGFYSTDGAQVQPIGAGKLDRWFSDDADPGAYGQMSSLMDPTRQLYMLAYRSGDATGSANDSILLYNWAAQRWTVVRAETEVLCSMLSASMTLEDLDDISSSIDDLPASLDSRQWISNARYRGAIDTDHKLGTFTGAALEATFETGEAALGNGGATRAMVQTVRPIADGTRTVALGTRDDQADAVTWGAARSPARDGTCGFRGDARFHRVRMTVSGDWAKAQGIDVQSVVTAGT
jgi:hypothetical protein